MKLKLESSTVDDLLSQSGLYKKSTVDIKNVIFDIGGVVLNLNSSYVISQIFTDSDVTHILKHTYRSSHWNIFDKGDISDEELINSIAEHIPCSKEKVIQFIELTKESWTPNVETIELIKTLHEAGVKLFALTNMPAGIQLYLRENHSFWQYFSGIYVSSELHMAKPDSDIYSYFIQDSGVKPSESLFIDDRLDNVTSAKQLGFNTIHFQQANQCRQKLTDNFQLLPNHSSATYQL